MFMDYQKPAPVLNTRQIRELRSRYWQNREIHEQRQLDLASGTVKQGEYA